MPTPPEEAGQEITYCVFVCCGYRVAECNKDDGAMIFYTDGSIQAVCQNVKTSPAR
jgi:hypothetical protein